MDEIYLNEQLKIYYKDSLKQEIEFGNIDIDIINNLINICKSDNIRPIFSKKGNQDIKKYFESYLRIAFSMKVEKQIINNFIPMLSEKYTVFNESEFKHKIINPYLQLERQKTEQNKGSNWLVDPHFFNVSQIELRLVKGNNFLHDKFWSDLTGYLSIL